MARVTLFSSASSAAPNDCHVPFNADLPEGRYQLCVESFVCGAYTSPYAVTASGVFNSTSWDNAVGERVTLVVGPVSNPVGVTSDSVGHRLGPNLKSQSLRIRVVGADGQTLAAGFPAWVMQCLIIRIDDSD